VSDGNQLYGFAKLIYAGRCSNCTKWYISHRKTINFDVAKGDLDW